MKEPVIEYYYGVDTKKTMDKILEIKGIPHVIIIESERYCPLGRFSSARNLNNPESRKNLNRKIQVN